MVVAVASDMPLVQHKDDDGEEEEEEDNDDVGREISSPEYQLPKPCGRREEPPPDGPPEHLHHHTCLMHACVLPSSDDAASSWEERLALLGRLWGAADGRTGGHHPRPR